MKNEIHFYDESFGNNTKRAAFQVSHSSEVESQLGDKTDFIEGMKEMMEVYKNLDSKGSIILKALNQALSLGSLQLTATASLLRHLSVFCGKDVRVTVTLENFAPYYDLPEIGRMSTKGMAVVPKCEDIAVKFPSPAVFNMFYNSCRRISTKMTIEVEVTSPKPVLPTIQPKPCNKVYKKMLEDEIHSDVVIIAKDGGLVKCHKSVLSTCSSVFEAMFQTDMKESKTHQIDMALEYII